MLHEGFGWYAIIMRDYCRTARVTSVLWAGPIWAYLNSHTRSPVDISSFWHSGYEVFEFNQLAHAFEMRPSRELALKARLTSNTIMAVIGVLGRVDFMKKDKRGYDTQKRGQARYQIEGIYYKFRSSFRSLYFRESALHVLITQVTEGGQFLESDEKMIEIRRFFCNAARLSLTIKLCLPCWAWLIKDPSCTHGRIEGSLIFHCQIRRSRCELKVSLSIP